MKNIKRGHAETPYLVVIASTILGFVWAGALCIKHSEYSVLRRILTFLVAPFVGFLFLIPCVAFILIVGFLGTWLEQKIAARRSRKS